MQRWALCVLLIAAIVSLAGCSTDDDEIASVVTTGLTSNDPRDVCEGALSPALLARIYGTAQRCHEIESEPTERVTRPKSVRIRQVRTHGSRATAEIELSGGTRDGAHGTLSLVRSGGEWRVSDLSVGLLRSQFEAGLSKATALDEGVRVCIAAKMRALDDRSFKELAYSTSERSQRHLGSVAMHCAAQIEQVARQAA